MAAWYFYTSGSIRYSVDAAGNHSFAGPTLTVNPPATFTSSITASGTIKGNAGVQACGFDANGATIRLNGGAARLDAMFRLTRRTFSPAH